MTRTIRVWLARVGRRLPPWAASASYELLTQAIVWLGIAREQLFLFRAWHRVEHRTFDVFDFERWSCCDCGLEHDTRAIGFGNEVCEHEPDQSGMKTIAHMWPVRPTGYGYRLRHGAGPPTFAKTRYK